MHPILTVPAKEMGELAARSNFKPPEKARVLITGVTGMLGAYLALIFMAIDKRYGLGLELFGMARKHQKIRELFSELPLVPVPGDVADALPDLPRFDYIVHAASPVGPEQFSKNPAGVVCANLAGTINLLNKARQDDSSSFLFLSTHEVYGMGHTIFRESDYGLLDFMAPRSCYSEAKRAGENACICYQKEYGIHTGIARLSRIFGPNMNLDSGLFICDFYKDALGGKPIVVRGGSRLVRPLCYAADAVEGILAILFKGKPGAAYNVSPDEAFTIGEIAERLGSLTGTGVDCQESGNAVPGGGPVQDNSALRELGWSPCTSLDKGLKDVYAALKNGVQHAS